jgi:hypothetical protein
MSVRVVVVGGGPAGMSAAVAAAEAGARVTLLEKGPILGRKLRITGKGRCNITNTGDLDRFVNAFEPNGKFLYGAFSKFFNEDLRTLLEGVGVPTKVERGGRVFPVSDSAVELAEALARKVLAAGVEVKPSTRVQSLRTAESHVEGVDIFGGTIPADAVVVATGGLSYPKTGSTGDGYAWAAQVGHGLAATRPALSGLECVENWPGRCAGLALRNVEACLRAPSGKGVRSEFGEMLFAHFGVTGPIVLTLSRWVHGFSAGGTGCPTLSIDLKPALTPEQLDDRLMRDFRQSKHFGNCVKGLMPQSLGAVFPELCGIEASRPVNKINALERRKIVEALKGLKLTIRGLRPIEEAIVTAGGISLKEIDPRTMESKLVEGLYFAGEIMDFDGETGGFNLQAAFSTGFVAGQAAARKRPAG